MCWFCLERLALMVADMERKGGHYALAEEVNLFEVAMVLQETKEPHVVLEAVESQNPAMLENPDLAIIVRCRVMMEKSSEKPSAWVHHTLVKKIVEKESRIPEAIDVVLDAVCRSDTGFLRKVIISPVTMQDFFAWDLWAQRLAARHLIQAEELAVFLPYDPRVRPALMFFVGMSLGQQERNLLATSMEDVLDMPGADEMEIVEYARMLRK